MKINSVEIRNFYSIKDIKVSFDEYGGIVIVKGKNLDTGGSNGAGKSALFEAVVWGLFGKTIRKSNEEALVNNIAKKNCAVTVTINDNIVVTRGRKPSKLEVVIDGVSHTQSHMSDTQLILESLLNTNYKVFMASMVFGQHNNVDFLGSTPEDKRTIIRNFLNLEDLFSKRDKIRGLKSRFNSIIKEKLAVIDEHSSSRRTILEKLKKLEKDKACYSYETVDFNLKLEDILDAEAEVRQLERDGKDLFIDRKGLRRKATEIRATVKKGSTVCPTCGSDRPIDKDLLSASLRAADGDISKISKKLVNLEKRLEAINIPMSSSQYSNYMEYRELCSKEDTYNELLEDLDIRIVEADKVKLENTRNYEVMRFWEKAFSESGLIKYIIRNILDYFNEKCNTYLAYMTNGQMLVHFNEELNESLTINGKITQYISLSGGEKRKINLAVMLALQSLLALTEKEQSNLLFFDEVAENLDEDGLKGLYILLQELKKDKTIFLITHNKSFKTLFDNASRLTIIKKGGVSHLRKATK